MSLFTGNNTFLWRLFENVIESNLQKIIFQSVFRWIKYHQRNRQKGSQMLFINKKCLWSKIALETLKWNLLWANWWCLPENHYTAINLKCSCVSKLHLTPNFLRILRLCSGPFMKSMLFSPKLTTRNEIYENKRIDKASELMAGFGSAGYVKLVMFLLRLRRCLSDFWLRKQNPFVDISGNCFYYRSWLQKDG